MTHSPAADTSPVTPERFDAMMQAFRAEAGAMFAKAHVDSIISTAHTTRELNGVPAPAEDEQAGSR